jgi:CzcA family heavy metal efflux pump
MNRFFLTYKNPLSVAIFLVILGGMLAYSKLQTALFPEITFPKIKIIAEAGEQPVDQMMLSVTRPLELAIKKVPDLKTIRSATSRGSCEISAFMDWNSDIDLSQQRIESKINEIRNALPADMEITVERMNPSILPVSGYTLEGKGWSPIDLKYLATYTIKPFLSQVEGVSEIRVIGGKEKEFWVELDQTKMRALGLTPEGISNTLAETDFIRSNGFLADYRMLYLTVTDIMLKDKKQLENLVIQNDSKRIIVLKDIARIGIREAKEYVKINANGKQSILIAVIKQPDANLIGLSDNMSNKISDLRNILPPGVDIQPYYVQADFVNDTVRSVSDAMWLGLLLAIIVVILFLRSLKASATVLFTIPVTLFLTLVVLYATGQTLNIMTLGAIAAAIGLVIDDAIVVVEQIHRTHEENPEETSPHLVQKAIHYLFPAMVGSSLSTIVIFLPFVLMTGVAGAYFKIMTNAMIITLVCSFIVTWIALPVIYLLLTREGKSHSLASSHAVRTQPWVNYFIRRPWLSISFVFLLVLAIVVILPKIETGFLPEMDEGSIVLDYLSPSGTSLEETDHILQEVEKIITVIPEVATYSRRTGTEMGFFITEPNSGDYLIQLKKNRKRSTEEVIEDIRTRIEATQPALEIDFGQVFGDMLGDLMASVQPVEVKIFGNDRKKLEEYAQRVAEIVDHVEGTADVFDGIIITGPYVVLEPDATRLARFGITPANLQYQAQTLLEGNIIGSIYEKEQFTPVRMIFPGSNNAGIETLKKFQVFLPDGKLKSVSDLAQFRLIAGDPQIQRENLQNMGVVTARLSGRDLGSVMQDIQGRVSEEISLPEGYSVVYGGAYADQQKSFNELLIILVSACLLVFCVILALYKDFRVAFTILLIAILGIAGCIMSLFFTGTPLNVGSYTGLIMIVGIIGENAIFTILQYREARLSKGVDDSIIYAISTRLRPKLMTALGAIISLMPLAIGIGTGAQLHRPLAIAIIGGFIIAMPLLLIVLPSLLRILYKKEASNFLPSTA